MNPQSLTLYTQWSFGELVKLLKNSLVWTWFLCINCFQATPFKVRNLQFALKTIQLLNPILHMGVGGGGTLLPFGVKVAFKDVIVLIFQKWCITIPVVFWKYLIMYFGQFRYTMNNQPVIVFYAKITKPFTNYHKFTI